jgi:phosphatidylglycerol:prolipoprotein diacylglycerol transferase
MLPIGALMHVAAPPPRVLIALLMFAVIRRPRPGVVAALYLTGYAVTQFVVFFWRDNSITALGLKQAQLTSVGTFAASLALLWWLNRYPRTIPPLPTAATPAGPPDAPATGANVQSP